MTVGRVVALWRYPVKSMLGEPLQRAVLRADGVAGDRELALRDADTGRVLSAKRLGALLEARARTDGDRVEILLPDGGCLAVDDGEAASVLSRWLGRRVVVAAAPHDATRPVIENERGTFLGRPGGFFDSSPVHVLTTATLDRLRRMAPGADFDARRFRPNILVRTPEGVEGFVEQGWLGRTIAVGAVGLDIGKPCSRCVLTTRAQEELPADRTILRTVTKRAGSLAGVYGWPRAEGEVAVGDEVSLVEN